MLGSGRVGRIVAAAAAKHLTPVTLELGGKSPVIVDTDADFQLTARRVLWGKSMNAGQVCQRIPPGIFVSNPSFRFQTCTAPDYVLVPKHVQAKLVDAMKIEYKKFFGEDPRASDSFSRICAPPHWERIAGLLAETKGTSFRRASSIPVR